MGAIFPIFYIAVQYFLYYKINLYVILKKREIVPRLRNENTL